MIQVKVGTATCGIAAGSAAVFDKFLELAKGSDNIQINETGCIGLCYQEPLVEININNERFLYGNVTAKVAEKIFTTHIQQSEVVTKNLINKTKSEYAFPGQKRVILRRAGNIDPDNIEEYIEWEGYQGLKKAVQMTPQEVIEMMIESGCRGRGGAGFVIGKKWQLTAKNSGKKYVICNADEGDPGAFMDRALLEGDPHSVIEGMIICAYAIGADEGYIYCRAEYPLAIKRLEKAIADARQKNFLGQTILGTDFHFDLHIKEGAGAFVCGEETALIASIEGKRGMPRLRPPFPANSGLWNQPTNNNNVESYANASIILARGADEYWKLGTDNSRGTKIFAMAGKIKHGGLIEVEMGIPLKEIIFDIGGGILNDKKFKAVQLGGPSGGCIPEELLDTPVDYESLKASGAIVGSGGMIVLDETSCMVDVAKYFISFIQEESCGKCTFCRIGTKRMLEILERITQGKGVEEDIEKLQDLSLKIKNSSLCGLGQTAPNPVLTTFKYFKDEYLEHIRDKKCRAGVCTDLIQFSIIDENCTGCTACKKACPVNAITGEVKKVHQLDQSICIKCGACYKTCRFSAIKID